MTIKIVQAMTTAVMILTAVFAAAAVGGGGSSVERLRKNTHIIFKKLMPVEINENIPIGYMINDLKANLVGDQYSSDDYYFTFEFVNDLNEKFAPATPAKSAKTAAVHQHQAHMHHHHNHHLLSYIKNYFLLDSYTGTIHTSKSIDLENFCDLNLCQNRLVTGEDSETEDDEYEEPGTSWSRRENCLIQFKIKATRHIYMNRTLSVLQGGSGVEAAAPASLKDAVYHISFDLVIHDQNEFRPEFTHKDVLTFNVSEEFAPVKLPIGSIAYDNDCNDRTKLFYVVRVGRINQKSVDEFVKEARSHSSR
jgi:hypothetical protein